ncbi:hypothetical protein DPMN_035405 [Dreissena polymorpha]|uniref:Uncharacterized protein n=1 Tax=Dreissena polymorpha TaxID=45954 RepID=A0A9D4RMY3_DREPO|nr:hypothetical protein DPMN_035405 [Dreissena polymorpha]
MYYLYSQCARHCQLSYLNVSRPLLEHLPPPWAQHNLAFHLHSLYSQFVRHCQLSYLTLPRPLRQHLPPPRAQHNPPRHLHSFSTHSA